MSRNKQRDEIYYHRLSSFLNKSGGLAVKRFTKIKPLIFKIEEKSGKLYILKGHFYPIRVKQQWDFFECIGNHEILVPFLPFPNGRKTIDGGRITWTISPFISGRRLTYQLDNDRKRALDNIKTFHSYAKGIHIKDHLKPRIILERMEKRFYRFTQSAHVFKKFGYDRLYVEIHTISTKLLQIASNYPWQKEMNLAIEGGHWIHGDVASHNFIHGENMMLIDFDLLGTAPQLYDYMQLGQRFLPYIDWDLDTLLEYEMVPSEETAIWLTMIALPSDVMREWHLMTGKKDVKIKAYLKRMREDWEQRKIFLRNVQSMLQSK